MDKVYNHKLVEDRIYQEWEEKGYFKPEAQPKGKPYSIILPPPNVTGTLHLGHALMLVIEDILIRYHRMKGDKTLWLPGTDHAAIATQSKVETELFKTERKTRYDLGRDEFLKRVQNFVTESHDIIVSQIRRMGASVDWSREAYTLDEKRSLAVRTAFEQMYRDSIIYRGETIINWDPKLQTTVSDDEIEWKEETTPFYYLKYGPFIIGTARPETKFGDKYVVMHPDDKRYKKYSHGEKMEVEWINGKVVATVIKDESIDMNFGTGVMTITPWHDRADFEIAKKHNLDYQQIIDFHGKLLPIAKEFSGMHIQKARPEIIKKLREKGSVEKIQENYTHRIATNYRGGGIIEPQIKKQWLVDVDREFTLKNSKIKGIPSGSVVSLKGLMKRVIENDQISITPKRFESTYFHWVDNLRDWVISRQLWFGHRIPVWYRGEEIFCGVESPKDDGWEQDPDTLDTWFSSGSWTFSTLGWPGNSSDLQTFHPTDVLETGYDILFFWVARMILMSTYLLGDIPFKHVVLHGLVNDPLGKKMSKSKGNVVDPISLVDQYGADALRFALVYGTALGNDQTLSYAKLDGMKKFTNKLWNIARFIEINLQPDYLKGVELTPNRTISGLTPAMRINGGLKKEDEEIIQKINALSAEVSSYLEKYQFNLAAERLYEFIWHEFADKYIENVKKRIDVNSYLTLKFVFLDILKLLHSFMPFITEELHKQLGYKGEMLIIEKWPV